MKILYKSLRVGLHGKLFKLFKFKSMRDESGSSSTSENDPRITFIGRLLRKTKLDELPELWNILKGDMAFVGPRPTLPEVIATLEPEVREIILSVKPGLTGWGTLYDFNEEERLKGAQDPHKKFLEEIYPEIIKREIWYVQHKSLWLDIKIIFLTLWKIIKR